MPNNIVVNNMKTTYFRNVMSRASVTSVYTAENGIYGL